MMLGNGGSGDFTSNRQMLTQRLAIATRIDMIVSRPDIEIDIFSAEYKE